MSSFDNSQYHKAKQAETVCNARHAQAQQEQSKSAKPAHPWRKAAQVASLFDRSKLPDPVRYYEGQGIALTGRGAWLDAVCPFHEDTKPSMRVRVETGAFKCMACGAHGGDVLAFHQQLHGMTFKAAAVHLGAWKGAAK
jgi:hypothetical protein